MKAGQISSLLAGVALAFGAISAQAADLPVAGGAVVAAPPALYNWSGIYVGVNGGYGWGGGTNSVIRNQGDGAFVGGQIGYNAQFGNVVLGLEGDFQGAFIDDNFTVPANALAAGSPAAAAGARTSLDWFSTLRGRLGFSFDRFLVYVTGGAAWADYNVSIATLGSDSNTHWGYTVGGGAEVALWDKVSMKVEYKYLDFENETYNFAGPSNARFSPDLHTISLGLNYRF
jgi:outer membrane immunogenic protein